MPTQKPEPPILAAPRRDAVITAVITALTAAVFAVAADRGILTRIQRVDDAWLAPAAPRSARARSAALGTVRGPAMRRAQDMDELAAGRPASGRPAAGRLLPPSRYRNPGDVAGLVAGAGLLVVTLIAVAVGHRVLLGPDAGFGEPAAAAAGAAVCIAALPWLRPEWRRAGWAVLAAAGAAWLLTGTVRPAELILAAAVAVTVGLGVRVAAGVPDRRLGPDGIAAALEAALIAGLAGIGIRAGVAVPAVLTYRLATYWLPVAPGWAARHLLQRRDLI